MKHNNYFTTFVTKIYIQMRNSYIFFFTYINLLQIKNQYYYILTIILVHHKNQPKTVQFPDAQYLQNIRLK